MASVRYIILSACQRAGLTAQAGFENDAAAWIKNQGSQPCAFVGYRRGIGVAGYDNVSIMFGGNDARSSLRRVRDELEKSLDFRSESEITIEGYPTLVMTARVRKRIYGVFGGGVSPTPPVPPTPPTPPTPPNISMYFEAMEPGSHVSMASEKENAPDLEYSLDGENWQMWGYDTEHGLHAFDVITLENVGERVYIRGNNPQGLSENNGSLKTSRFILSGLLKADGNVMGLLDSSLALTDVPDYGFTGLFYNSFYGGDNALTTTPSLHFITSIATCGCQEMFSMCQQLNSVSAMPNLTTIGDSGCLRMFSSCPSFFTVKNIFPALETIEISGCKSMFQECSSLQYAADMPVLTRVEENGCEMMYYTNQMLKDSGDMPELTRIGINGCYSMYGGCSTLLRAAEMPKVEAVEDNGCAYMYSACTMLKTVADMPVLRSIGNYGAYYMYSSCAQIERAAKMPLLETVGAHGMRIAYSGCIALTEGADLPLLREIGVNGLHSMYSGDTALTKAIGIPSVQLFGNNCLSNMYSNCAFNMSDDGTTFNFAFPTLPVRIGGNEYTTAKSVAQLMGNITGFN